MEPLNIDPVIFEIGSLQVRWYGLMYVVGYVLGGFLLGKLSEKGYFKVAKEEIDKFVTYLLVGMFLGARFAYVFIYNWDYYSNNMAEMFSVWKGGLSFHGAIFGMAAAAYIFGRKRKIHLLEITDCCVLAGTQGIFWGRMGNFINSELYGRVTDVSWGIVFKGAGPYPRHPSQLYEGIGEGIILSIILWGLKPKFKYRGYLTGIFLIGYAIIRFIIEFFREADSQLGYYFNGTITMGQILCVVMILVGISMFFYGKKRNLVITN